VFLSQTFACNQSREEYLGGIPFKYLAGMSSALNFNLDSLIFVYIHKFVYDKYQRRN
jgi:hypothetical protein